MPAAIACEGERSPGLKSGEYHEEVEAPLDRNIGHQVVNSIGKMMGASDFRSGIRDAQAIGVSEAGRFMDPGKKDCVGSV